MTCKEISAETLQEIIEIISQAFLLNEQHTSVTPAPEG